MHGFRAFCPMLRFFLIFLCLQLTLFGLDLLNWVQEHVVLPWTTFLAYMCSSLVVWFDATAAAQGKVLWNTSTGFGVSIEAGCNGLEAYIVLFSGVMAFAATLGRKVNRLMLRITTGLLGGFVAIQALNMVRVISLFYLGQWNMAAFAFFHEYLWQALIILDALVFFLLWIRWCWNAPDTPLPDGGDESGPPPSAPMVPAA